MTRSTPIMIITPAHAIRLLLTLGVALGAASGCSEQEAPASAAPLADGIEGFPTAQDLIDHLRTTEPEMLQLAIVELVPTRNELEAALVAYVRSIANRRLQYARLIEASFGPDAQTEPLDPVMETLWQAIRTTEPEPHGQSRLILTYPRPDEREGTLMLVRRRGRWMIHVSSLTEGQEVTGTWYFNNHFSLMGELRALRRIIDQLESGDLATLAETEAELARLRALPRPRPGSIQPDEA